jgi:Cu2+-containing amine oxidase
VTKAGYLWCLPSGGRRFELNGYQLSDWLGWSLVLGHNPAQGISAWDIRYKGERIAYELSLQVRRVLSRAEPSSLFS